MRKILVLTVTLLYSLFVSATVGAVEVNSDYLNVNTGCADASYISFTATSRTEPGDYDIYVKLTTRGQVADVDVYTKIYDDQPTTICTKVGTTQATSDSWRKVGTASVMSSDFDTVFQLSSKEISAALSANRPMMMAVPKVNSTCVPTEECYIQIAGQVGYILPPGTLPGQDSLRFFKVRDPNTDTLSKVSYYVDGKIVSTTPRLGVFDLRYVVHNKQSLMSVLDYTSGQRIIIEQTPPASHKDNFSNYLFRLYASNPGLYTTLLSILSCVALAVMVLVLIHRYYVRRAWRQAHGLEAGKTEVILTDQQYLNEQRRKKIFAGIKTTTYIGGGFIAIALLIIAINSYGFIIYRVNGKSMTNSLADGTSVFVNRLPVTIAHMSGIEHVPARGDVVILRATYGIVDANLADSSSESYIIKRVIGLPGEKIVLKDGTITVYNKEHPDGFDPDKGSKWEATMIKSIEKESVTLELGSDEIFVSGDNRPGSVDSRFNGPITTKELIGIVPT